MRTFKTIAIVIGIYIAAFVVDVIVASGSPDYQGGVTVLVLLGFLAFLASCPQAQPHSFCDSHRPGSPPVDAAPRRTLHL